MSQERSSSKTSGKTLPESVRDFEKAFAELEQIATKMEAGDLSLEKSLQFFERGTQLARLCQQGLAAASQRVRELTAEDRWNDNQDENEDEGDGEEEDDYDDLDFANEDQGSERK